MLKNCANRGMSERIHSNRLCQELTRQFLIAPPPVVDSQTTLIARQSGVKITFTRNRQRFVNITFSSYRGESQVVRLKSFRYLGFTFFLLIISHVRVNIAKCM